MDKIKEYFKSLNLSYSLPLAVTFLLLIALVLVELNIMLVREDNSFIPLSFSFGLGLLLSFPLYPFTVMSNLFPSGSEAIYLYIPYLLFAYVTIGIFLELILWKSKLNKVKSRLIFLVLFSAIMLALAFIGFFYYLNN